jgi:hypothetical protein
MIYKLVHSAKFVICNDFFAIGKLTISFVLHEFVYVVNVVHTDLIKWCERGEMTIVVEEFQTWCGFPSMQGTIDYIHVSIVKAIVDYHKKILDVVVFDLIGSVNDLQILHNLPCKRHNIIDCLISVKVHKMDFHLTSLVTRGIL